MKRFLWCLLLVFVLGCLPAYAVEVYEGLDISVAEITMGENTIAVTVDFDNASKHEFSYGWVSPVSQMIVSTSGGGSHVLDIRSIRNGIPVGQSRQVFKVNGSSESEILSVSITNLVPLDNRGLPLIKGLEQVSFSAEIPVSEAAMVTAEEKPKDASTPESRLINGFFSINDMLTAGEKSKESSTSETRLINSFFSADDMSIVDEFISASSPSSPPLLFRVASVVFPLLFALMLFCIVSVGHKSAKFNSQLRKTVIAPTQENAEELLRLIRGSKLLRTAWSGSVYHGQRASVGEQFSRIILPSENISQETKDALRIELLSLGAIHIK